MRSSLVVAAIIAHGVRGQPPAPTGRGDCHTGCQLPLDNGKHWMNMTWDDCVRWYNQGCPNNVWPGVPTNQSSTCFPGTNAVSYGEEEGGFLCRVWVCGPDHQYDGNKAFTCVYSPDNRTSNSSETQAAKAFYKELKHTCLKKNASASLTDLDGVMTEAQAKEVCTRYQPPVTDITKTCKGYWYDSSTPALPETPDAKSAPCTLGVKQVSNSPPTWRITGLTGDCYLQDMDDKRHDSMGGCGYQGNDEWCCLGQQDQTTGKCDEANIYKSCGHVTTQDQGQTWGFQTCSQPQDPGSFNAGARMAAQFDDANGYVTCDTAGCKFHVYINRFTFYFHSYFQPLKDPTSPDECGNGTTGQTLLLSNAGEEECDTGYTSPGWRGYWNNAKKQPKPFGEMPHDGSYSTQRCAQKCNAQSGCIGYSLANDEDCWIYADFGDGSYTEWDSSTACKKAAPAPTPPPGPAPQVQLPIAVQNAYHYYPGQATMDYGQKSPTTGKYGYNDTSTIDYSTAWDKCMQDETCWTLDWECQGGACQDCTIEHVGDNAFNSRCASKFPLQGRPFTFSHDKGTYPGGVADRGVYIKAQCYTSYSPLIKCASENPIQIDTQVIIA